ncbi:MAG: hypothetical protein ACKO7V_09805, partial [Bacteroidota bacterium]
LIKIPIPVRPAIEAWRMMVHLASAQRVIPRTAKHRGNRRHTKIQNRTLPFLVSREYEFWIWDAEQGS